ncbi:Hypothetical predicted protein [Mytilus galloprovincialis]|uniref:Novel STAND NTPase 3 domain-containing protein n=1 Tax=Mytilus galloprovincialis TaxID=29158 RepID=A0A8B6BI36_MYTGA|nr:Hypothetical predicted protein [Mytilus galloprovincialis]
MASEFLSLEEENYVRMSLLLTGISPRAVRVLFDSEFAPKCLYSSLKKESSKLRELKRQHIISPPQWDRLFPPSHAKIIKKLEKWKKQDNMFINTRAAQHVLKCIKMQSCVTITASSGVGKTATLRHVALLMAEEGYEVLPLADPGDIVKFHNPNKESLIVIDDFCGKCSVNQTYIHVWESVIDDIEEIIENKKTKIIVACRLQVFQDNKFDFFSIFKSCVCNMLTDSICLLKSEKQSIAEIYLESKACEIVQYCDLYDCFPLLCKYYHVNPKLNIKDFFQNPFLVYEEEIENFYKKGYFGKFCALALCVIFNNRLPEDIFTEDIDEETITIIENTCEACKLDKGTSRLVLKDDLDSLLQSFLKKEHGVYQSINDKIFVFLNYFFGQKIIHCLIKNAGSCFIKEQFVLESQDCVEQFITVIPERYHDLYFRRMIDDWSKGKVQDVVCNINMKLPKFKDQFLCHLNVLDKSYQKQLVHTKDIYNTDTSLLQCCLEGDVSLTKWCCEIGGADINYCRPNGQSPLIIACEQGHAEIVRFLLERGVDYNKFDKWEWSPVVIACKNGYTEILSILEENGIIYDKCNRFNRSPLMLASEHGNTEIVRTLLKQGADFNKCNNDGQSSLIIACEHGHVNIIEILLASGSKYNECNKWGQSPVMMACKYGHIEIVRILLDRGVDCNKCTLWNETALMIACEQGYTEIVEMLLKRGAEHRNTFDKLGKSPVWITCRYGHIEILKILLDNGAEYSTCDSENRSPLLIAHKYGYQDMVWLLVQKTVDDNSGEMMDKSLLIFSLTCYPSEIVRIYLNCGVDFTICDNNDRSPLFLACEQGNVEVVSMLLHEGADCDKCDNNDQSPLSIACQNGRTEIVRILLNSGADYIKCDNNARSTLYFACEKGHSEIVKLLLSSGADNNMCDYNHLSLLSTACERGHTDIVRILLKSGADYIKCDNNARSPLYFACQRGHTEIVKLLLSSGADYNKFDKEGRSPLFISCVQRQEEIIRMLLDKGADCNKCEQNFCSLNMLNAEIALNKNVPSVDMFMYSKKNQEYKETCKMQLDNGSDLNIYDDKGMSPLILACVYGNDKIVRRLLDREADYNHFDIYGRSPVFFACHFGHIEIVRMLIAEGADHDYCDFHGLTPLQTAKQRNFHDIYTLLVEMKTRKPSTTIRRCITNLKTKNSFTIEDEVLYSREETK